jgi:hypothetical protein
VTADRKDALRGHWVHSHEEDTEDELTFRPSSHALPPSRGRTSLELRPDGSYVERSPGPVDVPEESGGEWSVDGDRLVLDAAGGAGRVWEIAAVDDDRLTLRKPRS